MDKIKLSYFTSFRELILDEGVSTIVVDEESGEELGYRMGNLEHLARTIAQGNNQFAETFELAMIFSDDSDEQFQASKSITQTWPLDIGLYLNGKENDIITLEDLAVRIPSQPWRQIKNPREKAKAKQAYEQQILSHLHANDVDLVIVDSYLTLFDNVLLKGYQGRILNIHPAITDLSNPYRLPGVTPTRDAYTRARYGFVIVDDKKKPETWPEGEVAEVQFQGRTRKAVNTPKYAITGVTVHVIDELVDHGSVVMQLEHHFTPDTTYEGIRAGNYDLKRQILPEALLHYVGRQDVQEIMAAGKQDIIKPRVL